MDDIIHLLPDSVANQIAAGEVVQRPSSIIKEMVENSIDAGAKNIQVLVADGGKSCVQVIDDGKGMSETDARLAFERHATSKIRQASDLFNLTTMGFRGEALASIAAVAQVELKTRRPDDELGTMIQIAGSKIEKQEPLMSLPSVALSSDASKSTFMVTPFPPLVNIQQRGDTAQSRRRRCSIPAKSLLNSAGFGALARRYIQFGQTQQGI